VLTGKPVVRGTRLSVEFVIGLLGQGWTEAEIMRKFPGLDREDILARLQYTGEVMRAERAYPLAPADGQ
jgi:uncharacterized protein (DUF433 family)